MISVVTPWRTLLSAFGLIGSVKSEWVLMSMKPGATTRPDASMVLRAALAMCPTATIRPSLMATSPAAPGLPAPSNSIPPRIRMSCKLLLHAQRQSRSGAVAAGRRIDIGVACDRYRAAGAGDRHHPLARAAGQVAVAVGAAPLTQRV